MDAAAAVTTKDGAARTPREALATVPWLAAVQPGVLDRLCEHAILHRVPSGSVVFEQAETPSFAQIIVDGSVELLAVRGTEEVMVEFVRAADILLPAAVLNRQPFLLRARILEEAHIVMIEAQAFRDAVGADHALCLAILACQAAHFRRQVKRAKNIKLRSAEERVGCYLIELIQAAPPGSAVRLPTEKRLIASELGMTRETFSRTLSVVAKHGIRLEGNAVLLDDMATATARFRLDPLIDGAEQMTPLPIRS